MVRAPVLLVLRSVGASPYPYDDAGRAGEGELVALVAEDGGEVVLHLPGFAETDVRAGFDAVAAHPDVSLTDPGYPHGGVAYQIGGAVPVEGGPQPGCGGAQGQPVA
jgi:hypothetical protein